MLVDMIHSNAPPANLLCNEYSDDLICIDQYKKIDIQLTFPWEISAVYDKKDKQECCSRML